MYVPFKQASLVSELKSWCLSKLQNMDLHFTGDPGSTKLRRSSSVAEGLDEADGAGLDVLPSGQGGSSQCLELHSSPALLDSSRGEPSVAEGGSANHYFVVHVESSPGNPSTNSSPFTRETESSNLYLSDYFHMKPTYFKHQRACQLQAGNGC